MIFKGGRRMIFKSERAIEEEVSRRISQYERDRSIDSRLCTLEDKVRELEYRMARIEDCLFGHGPTTVNGGNTCREP